MNLINIPTIVDLETINKLIIPSIEQMPENGVYVEIGVFIGGVVCTVGQIAKNLKKKIEIYAIDTFLCDNVSIESRRQVNCYKDFYQEFINNINKVNITDLVHVRKGDSLDVVDLFEDKSIDVLFIDGDHNFPKTKNELQRYLPKVKVGGKIIGHDFDAGGVKQGIIELIGIDKVENHNTSYLYIKE